MRKFMKGLLFTAAVVFSAVLTACTPQQPQPPGPVVEIVERTDLLDSITIGHIITENDIQILKEKGIALDFQNIQLTGDNAIAFDLILSSGTSFCTLPVQAIVSYEKETVNGKDVFSDIQLYWGGVSVDENEIIVTNLTRLSRFSADDLSAPRTVIDLSGVMGQDGYILSSDIQQNRYAFLYHTPQDDGFAIFDEKGIMLEKTVLSTEGCHLLKAAEAGSLPFDSSFTPAIQFSKNGDILAAGQSSAWYYNTADKILLSALQPLAATEKDGSEYAVYNLTAAAGYEGTTQASLYLALKTTGGRYTDSMFFDGYSLLGSTENEKQLSVRAGTPVLYVPAIGLEMDIDMRTDTVLPRYKIQPEMLGQRIYISADRKYELYPMEITGTVHIALKEISTGKIRFISALGTLNHGAYSGETGFMADGSVYVLGDNDFRIYNTDMEALSPVFALSDCMPLGKNINTALDSRILVAAGKADDGTVAAVYYDVPYSENMAELYTDETLQQYKTTYQVAVADRQGNISAVYDTGMNAVAGHCPVILSLRRNRLNITVTYADTAHIITKGSLDFADGSFTISQSYTPYEQ